MDPYAQILSRLFQAGIRFVVIGVGGANYYSRGGQTLFATQDSDIFLPSDPQNPVDARRYPRAVVCGY